MEQEHLGSGDNVAGNKYVENKMYNPENIGERVSSKLDTLRNFNSMDFKNRDIISAIEEVFIDLIKGEQKKSHDIVPISEIRNHFGDLLSEDTFNNIIKTLHSNDKINLKKVQVCYVKKNLDYEVSL